MTEISSIENKIRVSVTLIPEEVRSEPRAAQLEKILAVRKVGKREALSRVQA
jgi:hypothetical protein